MLLNKPLHFSLFILAACVLASCIDVSSTGPQIPNYTAQFRYLLVDPKAPVASTFSVKYAEGPSFSSYSNVSVGTYGTETAFSTYNAGSKKFVYWRIAAGDTTKDTVVVAYESDQRATLLVAPTRSASDSRFIKLPNRYTFASTVGVQDSSSIRFVNLLLGAQDTIGIRRDSSTAGTLVGSKLLFGKVSSSLVKVPKGKTYKYFFTDPSSNNRVFKDSIVIAGGTYKLYTVVVYDKYDSTGATLSDRIKNVKVKVLEEN